MNPEVNQYIERRYKRWLDYATYHCSHANMVDEAYDVLNEVVASLMEKDEGKLLKMYNLKKNGYRELDFFVLRMIKLNIYSPTSPYQSRYKKVVNSEIEFSRLNIPDEDYDPDDDKPARILAQCNQVREIIETLNLSEKAKRIFHHRFFLGLSFSSWEGTESKNELYDTYNKIVRLIQRRINRSSLL